MATLSTIPRRIGFYTLRKAAYEICKYVPLFTPIIKKTFPDNTALHDALEAANLACGVLVAAIDNQAEPGV